MDNRDEIIGWLVLWTNWSIVAFENKTDQELLELFGRLSELNGG